MNRPTAILRQGLPIRYVWLALPPVMAFIALNLTPLKEGDLWLHIKIGEQISDLHRIPSADVFTFTAWGTPYDFSNSWLSGLLLYFFEKTGGMATLVLIQSVVGVATVALILRESLRRGARPAVAAVLTSVGWLGFYPFGSARPQIFSFLLFATLSVILSDYLKRRRNHLWLMPVLMVLWVNLHPSWPLGLALIGVGTVSSVLINSRRGSVARLKPLFYWGAAALVAVFANPDGLGVYSNVLAVSANPIVQRSISEWQPLVITNRLSWPFLFIAAAWILGLVAARKRPALDDILVMLLVATLSLRYMRMLPYFFAAATPIAAGVLSRTNWRAALARIEGHAHEEGHSVPHARQINLAFLVVLGSLAILSLPRIRVDLFSRDETTLISPHFPVSSVSALEKNLEPGTKLYNTAEWGGYIIWRLNPQGLVFVDGRVELFPPGVWDDYFTIAAARDDWTAFLDEYGVDYLILDKDRQARLVSNAGRYGWGLVAEDEVAVIFHRKPR